jgi:pentatricopeptide repeat protein
MLVRIGLLGLRLCSCSRNAVVASSRCSAVAEASLRKFGGAWHRHLVTFHLQPQQRAHSTSRSKLGSTDVNTASLLNNLTSHKHSTKSTTRSSNNLNNNKIRAGNRGAPVPANKIAYFHQAFQKASEENDLAKAMSLFQSLRDKHTKPDTFMFDQVLAICSRKAAWSRAWTLYQQIKKRALTPTISTFGTLWNCAAEVCEVGMSKVNKSLQQSTDTSYTARVLEERANLIRNAHQRASYLRNEMRKFRIVPNVIVANTMLKLAKVAMDDVQAAAIVTILTDSSSSMLELLYLESCYEDSLDPNTTTNTNTTNSTSFALSSSIATTCAPATTVDLQADDEHSALNLLRNHSDSSSDVSADSSSSPPSPSEARAKLGNADITTFTTLLDMEGSHADGVQRALAVYKQVRDVGLRPDLRFYSALLGVCKRHRDADTALTVYKEMIALEQLVPNQFIATTLASIFLQSQWSSMAPELLHVALGIITNDSPVVPLLQQQLAALDDATGSKHKARPSGASDMLKALDSTAVNSLLHLATRKKYWRIQPQLHALFDPMTARTEGFVDDQIFVDLLLKIAKLHQVAISEFACATLANFYARKSRTQDALQYLSVDKLHDDSVCLC